MGIQSKAASPGEGTPARKQQSSVVARLTRVTMTTLDQTS
jgi:hypothetical protein